MKSLRLTTWLLPILLICSSALGQVRREPLTVQPQELVVLSVPSSTSSVLWTVIEPAEKINRVFETKEANSCVFVAAPAGGKVSVEALQIDWDKRTFAKTLWVVSSVGVTPPDPTPPPTPPTPPTPPDDIPNAAGFGKVSYSAAVVLHDATTARDLAGRYRRAANVIELQSSLVAPVWDDCLNAAPPAWEPWRVAIRSVPKRTRSTSEWIAAFREIARSLEAIK